MRSITFVVAGALLVGAGGCRREAVQGAVFTDVAQRMNSVERFVGETRVRTARGDAAVVRVDIRNWTLGGGLRVNELPLPAKGLMIVQFRRVFEWDSKPTTIQPPSKPSSSFGPEWGAHSTASAPPASIRPSAFSN